MNPRSSAVPFPQALVDLDHWLRQRGIFIHSHGHQDGQQGGQNENERKSRSFLWATCGDWDLRRIFPRQCKRSRVVVPSSCRRCTHHACTHAVLDVFMGTSRSPHFPHVHLCILAFMHVCMEACINVCMHKCIHTAGWCKTQLTPKHGMLTRRHRRAHTHTHSLTHSLTHTHTHTHTHLHTHTRSHTGGAT